MFAQGDPKRLGAMVRDAVLLAATLNDRSNLSQVPMVDGGEEVVFDLQVEASCGEEPEERIRGESVAGGDLVFIPVERALLPVHVLVRDVVELAGHGECETEY